MTFEERKRAQLDLLQRMWEAFSPSLKRGEVTEARGLYYDIENAIDEQRDAGAMDPCAEALYGAIQDYLREIDAPINFIPDPALRRLRETVESI